MFLDDILKEAREGKLAGKRDDELRAMLIECSNHLGHHSDIWASNQIPNAIQAIREELSSRQLAKKHQESIAEQQSLHQKAITQGKNLHQETMDELKELKISVDKLGHARLIDWWILVVGAIAAIGVVISLFLIH
jgi:hypothetical protein